MVWKMTERPKTVLASRALVKEFVEMEPAPHDRPLSERRLQVYDRILNAGDFRPVVWAAAVCDETGCTYRVNGKHTSTLLSGRDPLPEFWVTVERYRCKTLNEVAALYGTFDSSVASRTTKDINLSFAATLPELRDVQQKLIHLTVTAAANLKWTDTELRAVPPAERAEELFERADFVKWLGKVIPAANTKPMSVTRPLLRSPVVQAMMATYDRSPRLAMQFWEMVRDESAPENTDPTRTLSRFLVRAAMLTAGSGARGTRGKKVVTHREMFVKCLHAWNAWRAGETTNLNYYAAAPVPGVAK